MDYGTTRRSEIPIDHLDYRFIDKCTDVKYLEKILHVLRTGEEGHYPDLTSFCERQIERLAPRSRALRKDKPPAAAADFSWEEWQDIDSDFKDWLNDIKTKDQQQSASPNNVEHLPPVRAYTTCLSSNKSEGKENKEIKCKAPRNYREWDRFDTEKELSKIEESSEEKVQPINRSVSEIKKSVDTGGLSQDQVSSFAIREKEKGNEAFRSGDYEEAVSYYTRSISILPTVAAYNNRAQAEIKLKNWQNALNDCGRVLALEAGNVKALIRRATVFKNLCNYQAAASDLKIVLQHEPGNPTAKKLLDDVEKLIEKVGEAIHKGVRIQIEDIEGSDEEDIDISSGKQKAGVTEEGEIDMGNAHKKSSPKRDGETPKHNGPRKEPLSNGRPAPEYGKGDSEKAGRETNQNTEQILQHMSPAARLKAEGNQLFKNGQFGEAASKYTEAIKELHLNGTNEEELGVLYSNRAACQLKEGNCKECIEDCNRALELQPYSMKPLLRRAMANESLERYRDAYVDYKIALQIDQGMQVANDSINRITRTLIEQDGISWREKLPPIPSVPVSFLLQRHEGNTASSNSVQQPAGPAENNRPGSHAGESTEERFWTLKIEGNEHITNTRYREAVEKYTECLKLNSEDCTIYTNRALCYLKLCQYEEARLDCECALQRDDSNIKALYRRAQANKGLENYQQSAVDIKKTLALLPTNKPALALLEEITPYLTSTSQGKLRKKIEIEEVSEHEEPSQPVPTSPHGGPQDPNLSETSTKSQMPKPTNAYEFGQRINEARASRDTEACARLLSAIGPEDLPVFLSNKLEGDLLLMIIRSLKHGVLLQNPTLAYQHLSCLTKAERFQVALMFLDNEKAEIQSLFTSLSENPPERVRSEDILSLAREYGL